jgi:hypothetical protein
MGTQPSCVALLWQTLIENPGTAVNACSENTLIRSVGFFRKVRIFQEALGKRLLLTKKQRGIKIPDAFSASFCRLMPAGTKIDYLLEAVRK